jgi:hypothetical protein
VEESRNFGGSYIASVICNGHDLRINNLRIIRRIIVPIWSYLSNIFVLSEAARATLPIYIRRSTETKKLI